MKKYKVRTKKGKAKVKRTMGEFKRGMLHSGSKRGPKVTSRKQAVAISINQAKREETGRKTRKRARKAARR